MKSVNLQGTKSIYRNLLHFYTLTMNYQKEIKKNNPIYNCIKKNKILIPRTISNQQGKRHILRKLLDVDERNLR